MSDTAPKVVVVTGASRGIGAALVAAYLQVGWSVVANARHIAPSHDQNLLTVEGDVAQRATGERIIDATMDRFGHLDTLVNNAGIFTSRPFVDYTAEDYAAAVAVNLTGFFALTQLAVTKMLARQRGHVVTITTTLAEYASSSVPAALTALTKGGLASVTKSLAVEYAARGIRFNAISPGIIQTPEQPAESYAELGALHPLGRVGTVSDVVNGVLYLESSPFVTGEILHVDGGQSAGH
jgi:NAD(P)-dependent dehydrogenase (short-subunit alcohol dehydrogenase family)